MDYLSWNDMVAARFFCTDMKDRRVYLYITNDVIRELGNGPVYSDVLEKERLSLEYSRKVYRDARAHLNVKWSQKAGRRVSWIGSNGLIIG
jgi:hypothetical protein